MISTDSQQVNLEDIVIDPEFSTTLPELTDIERSGLLENLNRDGYLNKLVVWKNKNTLLDGHARLKLWKEHHRDDPEKRPDIFEVELEDRHAAKCWLIRNQLGRSNTPHVPEREFDPKHITVDPEFKSLIPPLGDGEYELLKADIARNGFQDPIAIWKNRSIVLDGHHRLRIWREEYDCD